MILFLIAIIALGLLWSAIDNWDGEKAMKEFCELECRQNVKSKYIF